ncbi:acyltransferase [Stenotrophomonas maltophilia]|uniref:acyltransferase family protein n=1 Tax=Stenotrophomonas maltophilia TaxID=40324 RepID=UPI0021C6991C|nr:acyltransferase family protein [Stenotrophomonas maltophilia]MCU1093126.1 acyltransferase [Stenotrophomonas maltophilia]
MQKYRADIDGLRSIAILPVLLYHTGIPLITGGYVGVDIFFVISGFLITGILLRDFDNNTYSVLSFYERRIRRIFPALAVVVFFTIICAPFILLPSEFEPFGRDVASSLLFVANINFWLQSGYFSPVSEAKPLLHMWSLGVEEQFYLIAPLALFVTVKYARRYRLAITLIAIGLSLGACIYLTPRSPSAAFYLLPTRAWELLVGSALAIYISTRDNPAPTRASGLIGAIGLALTMVPVFVYDKSTPFPGYAAIAPTAGAAMLIYAGPSSFAGRLLSTRPLVFIGHISYSLYLWHWPVITLFRNVGWLESSVGKAIVILLSSLLAWLTWRFVESPTRDRTKIGSRTLFVGAASSTAILLFVSAIYSSLGGWPGRLPASTVAFDAARNDYSPDRARCHFDGGLPDYSSACVLGPKNGLKVAVWGDSHGVEMAKAISEQGFSVRQLTYSSCPPSSNGVGTSNRPQCSDWNKQVAKSLADDKSTGVVILSAYFESPVSRSATRQNELARTASFLRSVGKHVIVIGPFPMISQRTDLPTYLARGGSAEHVIQLEGMKELESTLSKSATLYSPQRLFCQRDICNFAPGGNAILFDSHHPSMSAARLAAAQIAPLIHDVIGE